MPRLPLFRGTMPFGAAARSELAKAYNYVMGKYEKLIERILLGSSDANISFEDLCQLLRRLNFEERIRGSHHNFRKRGIVEKINLQKDQDKAKAYQVKQVRAVLVDNDLIAKEMKQ